MLGQIQFFKNNQSFLEHPKKNLGSTPPLSVKITVQWFYFHHKHFNHKLVGCYNVNARATSIFWKNWESFLEPHKKIWAALHHFWQKFQFNYSIFIIKILIVNWLATTM